MSFALQVEADIRSALADVQKLQKQISDMYKSVQKPLVLKTTGSSGASMQNQGNQYAKMWERLIDNRAKQEMQATQASFKQQEAAWKRQAQAGKQYQQEQIANARKVAAEQKRVNDAWKAQGAQGGGGAVASLQSMAKWAGAAYVAVKSLGVAFGEIGKGIEFNAMLESTSMAFKVMLKDAGAAKKLMADLKDLSMYTPIGLEESAKSAKQLVAYGFQANQLVGTMKMLGTVSSATGGRLDDLAYVYGTLRTQNKAYARDLMQFAMRGIPIYEELAKVMGMTTTQMMSKVKAGDIDIYFKDVEKAFQNMTNSGGVFAGMLEAKMKTVEGTMVVFGRTWQQAMGDATLGAMPAIANAFTSMTDTVRGLTPTFTAFGESLGEALSSVTPALTLIVQTLVQNLVSLFDILSKIAVGLSPILTGFAILTKALSDIIMLLGPLQSLVVGIGVYFLTKWPVSMGAASLATTGFAGTMAGLQTAMTAFMASPAGPILLALAGIAAIGGVMNLVIEQDTKIVDNFRKATDVLLESSSKQLEAAGIMNSLVSDKQVAHGARLDVAQQVYGNVPVASQYLQALQKNHEESVKRSQQAQFKSYKDVETFAAKIGKDALTTADTLMRNGIITRKVWEDVSASAQAAAEMAAKNARDSYYDAKEKAGATFGRLGINQTQYNKKRNIATGNYSDLMMDETTFDPTIAAQVFKQGIDTKMNLANSTGNKNLIEAEMNRYNDSIQASIETAFELLQTTGITENMKQEYKDYIGKLEGMKKPTGKGEKATPVQTTDLYQQMVASSTFDLVDDANLAYNQQLANITKTYQEVMASMVKNGKDTTQVTAEMNDAISLAKVQYEAKAKTVATRSAQGPDLKRVTELGVEEAKERALRGQLQGESSIRQAEIQGRITETDKEILATKEAQAQATRQASIYENAGIAMQVGFQAKMEDLSKQRMDLLEKSYTADASTSATAITGIPGAQAFSVTQSDRSKLEDQVAQYQAMIDSTNQYAGDVKTYTEAQVNAARLAAEKAQGELTQLDELQGLQAYQLKIEQDKLATDLASKDVKLQQLAIEKKKLSQAKFSKYQELEMSAASARVGAVGGGIAGQMALGSAENALALDNLQFEHQQKMDSLKIAEENMKSLSNQERAILLAKSKKDTEYLNTLYDLKVDLTNKEHAAQMQALKTQKAFEGDQQFFQNNKDMMANSGADAQYAFEQLFKSGNDVGGNLLAMAGSSAEVLGGAAIGATAGTDLGGMMSGANPIVGFATALMSAIAGLEEVQKVLNPFKTIVESIMGILAPLINAVFKPIANVLSFFGEVIGAILAPFQAIAAAAMSLAYLFVGILAPPIMVVANLFMGLAKFIVDYFVNPIIKFVNAFIDMINKAFGWAGVKLKRLSEVTLQTASDMEQAAEAAEDFANRLDMMGDMLDKSLSYLQDKLKEQADKAVKSAQDLYEVGAIGAQEYERRIMQANQYITAQQQEGVLQGALEAGATNNQDVIYAAILKIQQAQALVDEKFLMSVEDMNAYLRGVISKLTAVNVDDEKKSVTDATVTAQIDAIKANTAALIAGLPPGTSLSGSSGGTASGSGSGSTASPELLAWQKQVDTVTKGLITMAGRTDSASIIAIANLKALLAVLQMNKPSFAVGTGNVPSNMSANIHKGEMIVPETFASAIRKGEVSLGGGSGSGTNIYISVEGSVVTEEKLIQAVQKGAYKLKTVGAMTW